MAKPAKKKKVVPPADMTDQQALDIMKFSGGGAFTGGAAPDTGDAGSGLHIGGGLKKAGSTVLKGLSVPGSAVFTVTNKARNELVDLGGPKLNAVMPYIMAANPVTRLPGYGLAGLDYLKSTLGGKQLGAKSEDVSWKNAAGEFYKNKKGDSGYFTSYSKFLGTKNPYAVLGAQVALDPLWLVGFGTAPAKVAKAAKGITEAVELTQDAKKLSAAKGITSSLKDIKTTRVQPSLFKRTQLARGLTGSVKVGTPQLPKARKLLLAKGLTEGADVGRVVPSAMNRMQLATGLSETVKAALPAVSQSRRLAMARALTSIPSQAVKAGRVAEDGSAMAKALTGLSKAVAEAEHTSSRARKVRNVFGRVPKAKARKTPVIKPETRAALTRAFAAVGKAAEKEYPEYVRSVITATGWSKKGRKAAMARAFGAGRPEVALAEEAAQPVIGATGWANASRRETLAKALGGERVTSWAPPALKELPENPYAVNEFLQPENVQAALNARMTAAAEQFGERKQIMLKLFGNEFGTGLHINSQGLVKTALRSRMKGLKTMKPGVFQLQPIERAARALIRAGGETEDAVSRGVMMMAEKFGMVEHDANGVMRFATEPAVRIGVVRSVRQVVDNDTAERLTEMLRSKGLWDDSHDSVMRVMDSRYETMRAQDFAQGDVQKIRKSLEYAVKNAKTRFEKMDAQANLRDFISNVEGRHTPQAQRFSQTFVEREAIRKDFETGARARIGAQRFQANAEKMHKERKMFRNPFQHVTPEQFLDDMMAAGMSKDDAVAVYTMIAQDMAEKVGEGFAIEASKRLPEWNALELMTLREQHHIMIQVDQQIDELIELAVNNGDLNWAIKPGQEGSSKLLGKYDQERTPDIVRALKYGVNQNHPGSITNARSIEWLLNTGMPVFKAILTTINPAHYVSNAYGDAKNALINTQNSGWKGFHEAMRASQPRSAAWNLGRAGFRHGEDELGTAVKLTERDRAALAREWDLGNGKTMTGGELDMMARMVGLGRGYHTTDIGNMVNLFRAVDSGHGGTIMKWMTRQNVSRENAQRLVTWVNHMRAGDDPIIAGAKTVRVHFDYGELTNVEKLMMRNLFMFYTWSRKNIPLQLTGVAERPGLYNTLNAAEDSREKFLNEPGYYSEQGAVRTPLGNLTMPGDPYLDMYKFDATMSGFRKNVLGMGTPVVRVPIEVITNKQAFTGAPVTKVDDGYTPHWTAGLLRSLGAPEIPGVLQDARPRVGAEKSGSWPSWMSYSLSQFMGPQAATAQAMTDPNAEGNDLSMLIGRILGPKVQINKPETFARNKKYADAAKKANETRLRGLLN